MIESGLLRIHCTNVPNNIDLYLELQDVEMNDYANYHANIGGEALLIYSATPGTYYLMIKDGYNTDYSEQEITLNVQTDALDTFEYNDEFTVCKSIELNQFYTAKIIPIEDVDHYAFAIDEPKILKLKVDSISNKIDMYLEILDQEGVPVFDYFSDVGSPIDFGVSLANGMYYLRLKDGYNNSYSDLPYHFGINEYLVDTCEWNNNFENAKNVQISTQIQGNIYPIEDLDFFTFEVANSQTINIIVDSVSNKIDMYIELYDYEKVLLESQHGSTGSKVELSHDATPGRYYILLKDGYNSDFSEKNYCLEIR